MNANLPFSIFTCGLPSLRLTTALVSISVCYMWAFSVNEYQRGSTSYYDTAPTRSFKAFDVDDFIDSLFRPEDAFVHAASLNQTEVVRRWITKNHDVNALDKEGHMALGIAAQNQCMDVLHLLVDHGASVDQPQADGKTALHLACMWGRYEAATLLLLHGANTSNRDKDGQTPLHGACRNGHDRIVQLLLASSIDPFVADDCGATPFDLARDWQRVEILKTLDQYHQAIFKSLMQSAVLLALNPRSHSKSPLPSSMQHLPPPSISMESLLRMDLATLQSDVVLHYTQKVARLVPARTISTDKLQLLFVLSQKLLKWFLSERHELERLNCRLEKELVNALTSSSTSLQDEPRSLQVSVNGQYSQTDDGVPHEHQYIQTEQIPSEHQCIQTELVPSEHRCIQTEAAPSEHVYLQADLVPHEHQFVQTERVSHEHQCIQTDQASDRHQIIQTDEEMQMGVCGDTVGKVDVPCNLSGNDRDEASIPEVNHEATPHDTASLTMSQPFRTEESTIETYYRVHSAIIRLQRCIRGHVTRRRFFRMLEKLVNGT